jgi:hypothetical protein
MPDIRSIVEFNDIFQHPVALANDLICRSGLEDATFFFVLVDCWCATLSPFYTWYFCDRFRAYKVIIR